MPGPIADLGCGHGRHAAALHARLGRDVLGFELDPFALSHRLPGFAAVRADFFELPLRDRALAGAFAWYASLFSVPDERMPPLFAELARCLVPRGLLVMQTVPYERAAAAAPGRFETTLPDGAKLEEFARFDHASSRDEIHRRLELPDGRVLSARFFIRYFRLAELRALLSTAGLELAGVQGDLDGGALTPDSTDLIVLARRA